MVLDPRQKITAAIQDEASVSDERRANAAVAPLRECPLCRNRSQCWVVWTVETARDYCADVVVRLPVPSATSVVVCVTSHCHLPALHSAESKGP